MNQKKTAILAWLLCGIVGVGGILNFVFKPAGIERNSSISTVIDLFWSIMPFVFTVVAALIVSKQPRNAIGWLLMTPAVVIVLARPIENHLESFGSSPPEPTTFIMILTWFYGWSWLLLIFPLILSLLLFPTGKPPSARWGKIVPALLVLFLIFVFWATFAASLSPVDGDWQLQNPIGFIPNQLIEVSFLLPWLIGLGTFTLLCVASLFVRYRGAAVVERNQIKWLLYAAGVFAVIYIPGLFLGWEESYLFNLLFILAIIMIPVSIAVAILRYRLFDIDILIRKTLVYGGLTITLALVYFGGVVLLQSLFETISGQQSPVAIVISTLLIAALFNPLRKRIQNAIDQRFYRRKYNAEQALVEFAATARSETDLEALTAQVEGIVEKTMQPERVSLWLKPDPIRWSAPPSRDIGYHNGY